MFQSHASNLKNIIFKQGIVRFEEKATFESLTPITGSSLTGSIESPVVTPATQRLGEFIERKKVTRPVREDLGVGSERIGSATIPGAGIDTTDLDALRQGRNVTNFKHFSKGTLPRVSVNSPSLEDVNGYFLYGMNNFSYGQSDLYKKFNDTTNKLIAFEDFPGKLDPVEYVKSGNYILQYMIVNDLTRDIDKFIDPDTMDGVIEVFETRKKFANTSFADINLSGIRADFSLGDANYSEKGSNFMTSKLEKVQKKIDHYEDSEETLFGGFSFHRKGLLSGSIPSRTFALDGFIHDEYYRVTPFIETAELSTTFIFVDKLQNFAKQANMTFNVSPGNDASRNFSDIGSRFTATNSGFIFKKSNTDANVSGITINLGTDSLAFGGFIK